MAIDEYPSSDGMMHDECMVGIGGTPAHWYPGDRDVLPQAQLHHTVIERLKKERVRNFTTYGPYRPAPLRNHNIAKAFFVDPIRTVAVNESKPHLTNDGADQQLP